MAIDTSINNNTALQILGEIVNLLNNTPVALTPWIGLPPYTDTKTDLLYEIWQALKNGSAGGGGGSTRILQFQTNTNGLQGITLPGRIIVNNIVARCSGGITGVSLGVQAYPTLLLDSIDWDDFGIPGDIIKSFSPNVFIPETSELFTTNSIPPQGLKITYLITYTVLPKF